MIDLLCLYLELKFWGEKPNGKKGI